jgi:beta-glucosidase
MQDNQQSRSLGQLEAFMKVLKSMGLAALALSSAAQSAGPQSFEWGAASAAYQVEGAPSADNKGRSVWDVYLDDHQLAGPGISGAAAINFYDRGQYLKDIALFKRMGLTSYRFSISWPRIIPDGQGPVNVAAVAHYRQFIADLKAAGIRPMLTLYHWDMPAGLAAKGGWENRASIEWYRRYAAVVFANFADIVDLFVLVNEPSIERYMKIAATERMAGREGKFQLLPAPEHVAGSLKSYNHILLAAAAAKRDFDAKGYKGQLGVSLPLSPMLTEENASNADRAAARIADGLHNRWFLDAILKGRYPDDILKLAEARRLQIDVQPEDAATIGSAHFDFVGVNYYAPTFIRRPKTGNDPYAVEAFTPSGIDAAVNGPNRPDQFQALLTRLHSEYNDPVIYVTENGAGFAGDDKLVNGAVHDVRRCHYLLEHVAAMQRAITAGARVRGYYVWSSHDNLEWLFGYGSRFGLIHVDFDTQQRTLKSSATTYAAIIAAGGRPEASQNSCE